MESTHNDNACIIGKQALFQSEGMLMVCESIITFRGGALSRLSPYLSPSVCSGAKPAKWRAWFHDIPEDESYVGIQTEAMSSVGQYRLEKNNVQWNKLIMI